MARIILAAMVVWASFAGQAAAAPDAAVFQNGDVRMTGAGNGLVFPDGSIQNSASTVAVQTVSAPGSISFPNGTMSPAQITCVQCPQGAVAVGGGGVQTGGIGFVLFNGSSPTPPATGWCVTWVASLSIAQSNTVQTWAICARGITLTP